MPSPFILALKSGWYPLFLEPVVKASTSSVTTRKVLDIGTGPGTLPAMLQQYSGLNITGTDINPSMIARAQANVWASNVEFMVQNEGVLQQLRDESFDAITACSVLFLLDEKTRTSLLNWTFFAWRTATASAAKKWQKEAWLSRYGHDHGWGYDTRDVFFGYATLETITKPQSKGSSL